jgi:hypothetical protein
VANFCDVAWLIPKTAAFGNATMANEFARPLFQRDELYLRRHGRNHRRRAQPSCSCAAGRRDGTTWGRPSHRGLVKPTLEVTLVETPARLRRKKQSKLGLALIDLAG